jgi:membrane protease subunit HflC
MKNALIIVIGVVVLLGLSVVGGAFYVVGETQQVVIFQFGEPRGESVITAGLKLKLPFIQKARYFDNRSVAQRAGSAIPARRHPRW